MSCAARWRHELTQRRQRAPVAAANEPPLPAEKPPAGGQVVKQENDTAQKEKERERERAQLSGGWGLPILLAPEQSKAKRERATSLGALLLVLHAYLRQPTCSLINWTGRGAITHYLAWALSPQIRIRSSEQTHSTRGILPGGNP